MAAKRIDTGPAQALGCVQINRMIKAYPTRQGCALDTGTHRLHGLLVDINSTSARILFADDAPVHLLRLDQRARLMTRIACTCRLLEDMPCVVAWIMGREAGIEFDTHLGVGIRELQRALDCVRRAA